MQENPIVDVLYEFFNRPGRDVQPRGQGRDLVVDQTAFEFKFHFDHHMHNLERELRDKHGDERTLEQMLEYCKPKSNPGGQGSWHVTPSIYHDMCNREIDHRLTDIFVWIVCARDLSRKTCPELQGICFSLEQCKWNWKHQYSALDENLKPAYQLLEKIRCERWFRSLRRDPRIITSADFPSTYQFIICDFPKTDASQTDKRL